MKKKLTAAFQGEAGAYSEVAALRVAGHTLPQPTFDLVFEAVKTRKVALGVIPIENSLGGSIHQNYDLLLRHDVQIIAETFVKVDHCLLGLKAATFSKAREVLSHPQALAQCTKLFEAHKHLVPTVAYDTAGSAKMISQEQDPTKFAIASSRAAELYGLKIFKRHIADETQNLTRFLVIQPARTKRLAMNTVTGQIKTSIVFTLPNEQGSLFKALSVFAMRNLNLSKIESRPYKPKAFDYLFYLDFWGDREGKAEERALAHLAETTPYLKVLGSYGQVQ
jgi:prephenate dehydratase